jgi:hypothetical protein
MNQLQQAEFEVEALFLSISQLIESSKHGLQEASQLFFGEERSGPGGAALLVG